MSVYSKGLVRPAWLLVFLPCPPSRSFPHAHSACHHRSGFGAGGASSSVGTAAAPPRQPGPAYPNPAPPSTGDSRGAADSDWDAFGGSANGLEGCIVGVVGEVGLTSYGLLGACAVLGEDSCDMVSLKITSPVSVTHLQLLRSMPLLVLSHKASHVSPNAAALAAKSPSHDGHWPSAARERSGGRVCRC